MKDTEKSSSCEVCLSFSDPESGTTDSGYCGTVFFFFAFLLPWILYGYLYRVSTGFEVANQGVLTLHCSSLLVL